MKVLRYKEKGTPDNLVYEEVAEPKADAGQVKIEVQNTGVNYLDILILAARYKARQTMPITPSAETNGIVVEVGEGVTDLAVGDRVTAHQIIGGFAEYVLCHVKTGCCKRMFAI